MTGDEVIIAVTILGVIFAPLSLGAYLTRRAVLRMRDRLRRKRLAAAYRAIRELKYRPVEQPMAPRVMYVPYHDRDRYTPLTQEEIADSHMLIATPALPVFMGWDMAEPKEVFEGKGGASGGAGASATWEAPEQKTATVVDTPTFETSETTIEEPAS